MTLGTVLVTGASGYIGSHVVSNLLARGRDVRATVRDASDPGRVDHLRALPVSEGGSLEIVEMDLMDADSVSRAVAGCCEVIHTAAAVRITAKKPQSQIVDPSVIGTLYRSILPDLSLRVTTLPARSVLSAARRSRSSSMSRSYPPALRAAVLARSCSRIVRMLAMPSI